VYTDDDIASVGYVVALTKTVILRGGYDATFADPPDPDANPTTLDARQLGRVISITGDISPTIEGFTITGGDASGLGGALVNEIPADVGGGIYSRNASPIIVNNVVVGNIASTLTDTMGLGGGIGLQSASASAVISSNQVFSNVASTGFGGQGGGLYLGESVATVSGNTVYSNTGSTANHGGGMDVSESAASGGSGVEDVSESAASGGGGIYVSESEATIGDNLVHGNTGSIATDGVGGGVAVFGSNNTVVSGNTVLFNIGSTGGIGKGGGMGFKYNTNLSVSDNQVEGNIGSTARWGYGGGIFLKYTRVAQVNGNTVLSNTANTAGEGRGGGLLLTRSSGITLYGNRVQGNVASTAAVGMGGGLYIRFDNSFTLINNLVIGNSGPTEGNGLAIMGKADGPVVGKVLHTTIADNVGSEQAVLVGQYTTLDLVNSIITGHSGPSITAMADSTVAPRYNLFWDNGSDPIMGMEAIVGDPLFVDSAGGDYHIQAGSAAIDAGDPTDVPPPPETDLDGNPRVVDGDLDGTAVVDMGTYEFQPEVHLLLLPLIMKAEQLVVGHWSLVPKK